MSITTSLPERDRPDAVPRRPRPRPSPSSCGASARSCATSSAWSPSAPPREAEVEGARSRGRCHGRFRVRPDEAGPPREGRAARSRGARRRRAAAAVDRRGGDARRGRGEAGVRRGQPPDRHGVRQAPRVGPERPRPGPHRGRRRASTPASSRPPGSTPWRSGRSTTSPQLAESHRERLAAIAADQPEGQPQSRAPGARPRKTSTKFDDPLDELFHRLSRMEAPLKLLEGLFIPKLMQGPARPGSTSSSSGRCSGSASMAGGGAAGIGGGLAAGAAAAVLLRIWLLKLSRCQLERLYTAAHARPGRRR